MGVRRTDRRRGQARGSTPLSKPVTPRGRPRRQDPDCAPPCSRSSIPCAAIREPRRAASGPRSGNVEEDRPEWHAFDTVKGGDYLVDQGAAVLLAEDAIRAVYDLENRGLAFSRTADGRIDQRRFGGHTRNFGEGPVRRSCYAADRTGHQILQTLYQQCIKNGVEFFDEFHVLDVILEGRRCCGVAAIELATGEVHLFKARAVLFATGGFGRMFRVTSNAYANTGDGPAVLARRGVPLQDMEFFQFHPTGIRGLGILITEAVRGEGGILRNRRGERFMERYAPTLLDLAPRDMISRAILSEIKSGNGMKGDGTIDDWVLLDTTHLGREVLEKKLPDITGFSRTYLGIDPGRGADPGAADRALRDGRNPHGHRRQGDRGRRRAVSMRACTRRANARACRCTGRTGWGRTASWTWSSSAGGPGRHMADFVKNADRAAVPADAADPARAEVARLTDGARGPQANVIRAEMESVMMERVGIFRNEVDLSRAEDKMRELRGRWREVRVCRTPPGGSTPTSSACWSWATCWIWPS